jgi:hypothetical protein
MNESLTLERAVVNKKNQPKENIGLKRPKRAEAAAGSLEPEI